MNIKPKTLTKETNNRKVDLISATLRVIASDGVKAATVRSISEEANVTQGLIQYHFKSKDELIIAAYEEHMTSLITVASRASDGNYDSDKKRLATFVKASVKSPIVDAQPLAIWAVFFSFYFTIMECERTIKKPTTYYETVFNY